MYNKGAVMGKSAKSSQNISIVKRVGIGFGVLVLVGIIGSHNQPTTLNATTASQATKSSTLKNVGSAATQQATKAPVVTTQTTTELQSIPYSSTTVNSAAMPQGQSEVTTMGLNGMQTLTYKVTLTNGLQTNKQLVSSVITSAPVAQVTTVGTYIAPTPAPTTTESTYTNVDGNQVESPDSNTAGATALCNDGSYSHSEHRSGTCSDHGGVQQWL
jgi:hypothetical protein